MNRSIVVLGFVASLAGCYANHEVGATGAVVAGVDMVATVLPNDSLVLETDGMTFSLSCVDHEFQIGGGCGSLIGGGGPSFSTDGCSMSPTKLPNYMVTVLFRNFDPAGITSETTFDLSDPGHGQFVTVMFNYLDLKQTEWEYCSDPATADAGAPAASKGIITVHKYTPPTAPSLPPDFYSADVELTDIVLPSLNGGPPFKIVSAHLYN